MKHKERPPLDFNNLPPALTPEEAAAVLRISSDSYYEYVHPLVKEGKIHSYNIGRCRRILTSSLLAWQEAQAKEAA